MLGTHYWLCAKGLRLFKPSGFMSGSNGKSKGGFTTCEANHAVAVFTYLLTFQLGSFFVIRYVPEDGIR